MLAFLITTAAIAMALGVALATAPQDRFETEIFIVAPPETVWSLLTDPVEHAAWNPSMRAVAGRFVSGERLRLEMLTPSGGVMTFHPRVLVADPGRELRWLGRLWLPRLFDGEHYFRLIPKNGGTRLIHGERFRGVLLWVMNVQQFRPAFVAANEGLLSRAESLHLGNVGAGMASLGAEAFVASPPDESPQP
jgi:hypothetical protein